ELNDDAWSPAVMLARSNANRLLFEPWSGWAYSNIGYFHVRRLIERAMKSALADALERLVLAPLQIEGVRLSADRADFANAYDPKWVYYGLLMGPWASRRCCCSAGSAAICCRNPCYRPCWTDIQSAGRSPDVRGKRPATDLVS